LQPIFLLRPTEIRLFSSTVLGMRFNFGSSNTGVTFIYIARRNKEPPFVRVFGCCCQKKQRSNQLTRKNKNELTVFAFVYTEALLSTAAAALQRLTQL
jgi:hypothetical protein